MRATLALNGLNDKACAIIVLNLFEDASPYVDFPSKHSMSREILLKNEA